MTKSAHSRAFERLVADHRQLLLESLVKVVDLRVAGRINGLDEALKLSQQADSDLSGGAEPDADS